MTSDSIGPFADDSDRERSSCTPSLDRRGSWTPIWKEARERANAIQAPLTQNRSNLPPPRKTRMSKDTPKDAADISVSSRGRARSDDSLPHEGESSSHSIVGRVSVVQLSPSSSRMVLPRLVQRGHKRRVDAHLDHEDHSKQTQGEIDPARAVPGGCSTALGAARVPHGTPQMAGISSAKRRYSSTALRGVEVGDRARSRGNAKTTAC